MKVTFQFSGGLELVTETTEAVVDIDATEMKMSDVIAYVQKNLVKSASQPFINGNNVFVSLLLEHAMLYTMLIFLCVND